MLENEYSEYVKYANKYLQKHYSFVFRSEVDVEGCIDEALTKAYLTFNQSTPFLTYFTCILKNQVLNEFRWCYKRKGVLQSFSLEYTYASKSESNMKDYLPYFDSYLLSEIRSILSEEEYEFFKVYYFSGYRQVDLVKKYQVSKTTINNWLRKIKNKLRKFY